MSLGHHQRCIVIGWREWVALPSLAPAHIEAKIDSGAETSSLHAERIRKVRVAGRSMLEFEVRLRETLLCVRARQVDVRSVRSSNGSSTLRPVVEATLAVAGVELPIELTLSDRSRMGLPLLLGRQALRGRFLVDASATHLLGTPEGVAPVSRTLRTAIPL